MKLSCILFVLFLVFAMAVANPKFALKTGAKPKTALDSLEGAGMGGLKADPDNALDSLEGAGMGGV